MAGAVAHMLGVNASAGGGGGGGVVPVTRQVYSNEVAGPVSNTDSTTPTSLVSLTFTPDANKTYAIFWSGEFTFGTNAAVSLILYEGGVEVLRAREVPKEFGGPVDYKLRGGFIIHAAGASPASTTWELKVVRPGASSTASARNGRLVALRLETGDYYGESLGDDTTTSTTYADKATVSFTGTGGDYLIIGSGIQTGSAADAGKSRLSDGTNTSYPVQMLQSAGTDMMAFGIAWARTAVSGSVTFRTQYATRAGGTSSTHNQYRILALAMDALYGDFNTTLGSDNGGTDIAYTDALSLTHTPAAADHLLFASWSMRGSNTTVSGQVQLRDGGVSVGQNIAEAASTLSGMGQGSFVCLPVTYAAASRTWDIQRLSENNTVTTTVEAGACIAGIQLEP
jgi:hypothetical protein